MELIMVEYEAFFDVGLRAWVRRSLGIDFMFGGDTGFNWDIQD